jgi:hypothetical protein
MYSEEYLDLRSKFVVKEDKENDVVRNFMMCIHLIPKRCSNQE